MPDDDFIADPTDHVLAVIDDHGQAEAAMRDFEEAGIAGVRTYRGARGADSIDASGSEHGLGGGLVRGLQQALTNKDNLAEYEEAVRDGATVLAVPASGSDDEDRVTGILERHGARTMTHFGKALVRTIKP